MYVSDVPVEFHSMVHFESNNGSALGVVGTYLNFTECDALFESNRGIDGGGIAILGAAHLLIGESTTMAFRNNYAQRHGGAIFSNYISKDSMKTYVHCFLRYSNPFYGPENWNSTFTFSKNWATFGQIHLLHIYTTLCMVSGDRHFQQYYKHLLLEHTTLELQWWKL